MRRSVASRGYLCNVAAAAGDGGGTESFISTTLANDAKFSFRKAPSKFPTVDKALDGSPLSGNFEIGRRGQKECDATSEMRKRTEHLTLVLDFPARLLKNSMTMMSIIIPPNAQALTTTKA